MSQPRRARSAATASESGAMPRTAESLSERLSMTEETQKKQTEQLTSIVQLLAVLPEMKAQLVHVNAAMLQVQSSMAERNEDTGEKTDGGDEMDEGTARTKKGGAKIIIVMPNTEKPTMKQLKIFADSFEKLLRLKKRKAKGSVRRSLSDLMLDDHTRQIVEFGEGVAERLIYETNAQSTLKSLFAHACTLDKSVMVSGPASGPVVKKVQLQALTRLKKFRKYIGNFRRLINSIYVGIVFDALIAGFGYTKRNPCDPAVIEQHELDFAACIAPFVSNGENDEDDDDDELPAPIGKSKLVCDPATPELYFSDAHPMIVSYDIVAQLLRVSEFTQDSGDFSVGILALCCIVGRYKFRVAHLQVDGDDDDDDNDVDNNADAGIKSYASMPAQKTVEEDLMNIIEWLLDAKRCPTEYEPLATAQEAELAADGE
eukprot:CAMPEP_0119311596 /NCGR_PEP_ID=MMETSP1333-20130426/23090_1 /TAXON_ID=418940 /ORGANISM="Scyphosphaera apsteinii, Strain RCC1455" /LENGTH=428 /DNA_ID=CAMNT_0007316021 /DNA_START=3 /DNA_END=1289 /DNA_ORIENTATION=+